MLRRLLTATVLAALLPAGVAHSAASRSVSVRDNYFSPSSASVKRGTKVSWRWRGRSPHNVVVRSGPTRFSSPVRSSGRYSRVLRRKGTYRIVCTIHGGMTMTLRVR